MHAVVFDIDGTLLESAAVDDELYRLAVTSVLGPVTFRDAMADYEHVSDSGILQQILVDNKIVDRPDPTSEIITTFVNALQMHISDNGAFREIPGARDFLTALRSSSNHYVAVATGGWSESATLKLQSAAFDLSGLTLSASNNERDRTRIMCAALDRPAKEYASVTYYGDGSWDEAACVQLGWNFVPVGPTLGGLERYPDAADFLCDL